MPMHQTTFTDVLQGIGGLLFGFVIFVLVLNSIAKFAHHSYTTRKHTDESFLAASNDIHSLAKLHDEMLKGMEYYVQRTGRVSADRKETEIEYWNLYVRVTQRYIELLKKEQSRYSDEHLKLLAAKWLIEESDKRQ